MKNSIAAVLSTLAVGCATFTLDGPSSVSRDLLTRMNSEKLGYYDGCMSAEFIMSRVYLTTVQDRYLYVHDGPYKQGWDQGYRSCRRSLRRWC